MFRSITLYGVSGLAALAVHYTTLIIGVEWMHADPVLSSAIGLLLGAATQYLFNHRFTFSGERNHLSTFTRHSLHVLTSFTINAALLYLLINQAGIHYLLAQGGVTVVLFILNYLVGKHWVYANLRNE